MKTEMFQFNVWSFVALIVFLASTLVSCTKEESRVVFRNRSVTNTTYDVIVDGGRVTVLSPFTDSDTLSFAPGRHTIKFIASNTGKVKCDEADPILQNDYIYTYTCTN